MHALLNRCRTLRGAGGKQQEPRFSHLNASIKQQTQQQQTQPRRASVAARVATLSRPEPASTTGRPAGGHDANQTIREGDYEADLVRAQARKRDPEQPSIASVLPALDPSVTSDVLVVGCGPAGLYLAALLAKRGLKVALIGHDVPFVNNYGVWLDEWQALGLMGTLECSWPDAVCYFGEGRETRIGRGYGRVSRRLFRSHLLEMCREAGVQFLADEVDDISLSADGKTSRVATKKGAHLAARLVNVSAGAAAGKFLKFDDVDAPSVAAQTAYGIEAEVEGYPDGYPADLMLFMDFRRHHTGVNDGMAHRLKTGVFEHPNSGGGLWGSASEPPSFLYAMPLGGRRVFLEETCLVAKPALPFAVLKRRLERRLRAMNVKVKKIHEVEWSFIPVGGPLPAVDQPITAFGAAANLIHPATGFSVSRSFAEAGPLADEMARVLLAAPDAAVADMAARVWRTLWPLEKRTQAAFHVFGMELLASLDLVGTNSFFHTFFRLPRAYWHGFLSCRLSSLALIGFAFTTFVQAPPAIKFKLVHHLMTDPSGKYLLKAYSARLAGEQAKAVAATPTGELAAAAALALALVQLSDRLLQ